MDADASSHSVLLIEDDDQLGARIASGLRAHGLPVVWRRTGHAGLTEADTAGFDVVLLDLGLPDADGIDVARTLRTRHRELVMILITARDSEIDVVAGLDAGADDYVTKPFSISVLLARMRAQLRRLPTAPYDPAPVTLGALTIDANTRRCSLDGHEVDLRPKEFDLLLTLASRAGSAVSRHDLMAQVWDDQWHGSTKTLDVTLAALRRRLGETQARHHIAPSTIPVITTLRGHGYRLEPPPGAAPQP